VVRLGEFDGRFGDDLPSARGDPDSPPCVIAHIQIQNLTAALVPVADEGLVLLAAVERFDVPQASSVA
jgi:hypothetical protein